MSQNSATNRTFFGGHHVEIFNQLKISDVKLWLRKQSSDIEHCLNVSLCAVPHNIHINILRVKTKTITALALASEQKIRTEQS